MTDRLRSILEGHAPIIRDNRKLGEMETLFITAVGTGALTEKFASAILKLAIGAASDAMDDNINHLADNATTPSVFKDRVQELYRGGEMTRKGLSLTLMAHEVGVTEAHQAGRSAAVRDMREFLNRSEGEESDDNG